MYSISRVHGRTSEEKKNTEITATEYATAIHVKMNGLCLTTAELTRFLLRSFILLRHVWKAQTDWVEFLSLTDAPLREAIKACDGEGLCFLLVMLLLLFFLFCFFSSELLVTVYIITALTSLFAWWSRQRHEFNPIHRRNAFRLNRLILKYLRYV